MTMTLDRAAPWELLDIDPDEILAALQARFPGVCLWRGEFTGRFFAAVLHPSRYDRLVEAATPGEFTRLLVAALRSQPAARHSMSPIPQRPVPAPAPSRRQAVPPARGRHEIPTRRSLRRWLASLWTD